MRDEATPEGGGNQAHGVLPSNAVLLRVDVGEVVMVLHQHGGHQPLLRGAGHCQSLLVQQVLEGLRQRQGEGGAVEEVNEPLPVHHGSEAASNVSSPAPHHVA